MLWFTRLLLNLWKDQEGQGRCLVEPPCLGTFGWRCHQLASGFGRESRLGFCDFQELVMTRRDHSTWLDDIGRMANKFDETQMMNPANVSLLCSPLPCLFNPHAKCFGLPLSSRCVHPKHQVLLQCNVVPRPGHLVRRLSAVVYSLCSHWVARTLPSQLLTVPENLRKSAPPFFLQRTSRSPMTVWD